MYNTARRPIPPLNPGKLPKIYTESPATRKPERSYKPYVPSLVAAEQRVCALGVPTPPVAPGELTKEGRSLTKRVKQVCTVALQILGHH